VPHLHDSLTVVKVGIVQSTTALLHTRSNLRTNHATEYVKGNVHTNDLENFWSLMKRNLAGTYVAVEPFHL
jgi:hypothetical protein